MRLGLHKRLSIKLIHFNGRSFANLKNDLILILYLIQLVTAADACWLTRRNSAFCSAIVRTIDVPGSNVRGKIVACHHLGHDEMEFKEGMDEEQEEKTKETPFTVSRRHATL